MEQCRPELERLGASIVGVAVTATFSQQRFAAELDVGFPLVSDWNREVSAAWGVAYDEWKGHRGVAKRSVFLVAPDGTVSYRWVSDDAGVMPDFEEAVQALRRLRGEPDDQRIGG